ncbi:MAG: cyclic nucleotide-binding domain-containing protein [Spirochaetales bacterium]|nr:MAG: cyclic nucleotide-binding domain-containing protein [Spirochaetales bacterium]
MNHFEFLKRVYFFKNLDDEEIRLVLSVCHEARYAPGEVLFPEGAVADRFYIVIEGRVEVWKNFNDPKPDLLGVHGPGHFFGEMALVDDLPRSATAVSREDTLVLFLYRDDFHALVRGHSSIALSVMMSMSYVVRRSNEVYVEDLSKRNEELERAYAELKRAQAERLRNERLSTLGNFSSLILHDIRNPLSIIKGQLQLMAMHLDDQERLRKSIEALSGETSRLERLAGEFLDFSRGEVRLDFNIVDPTELLEKITTALSPRLERDAIQLVVKSEAHGPALMDGERMTRVLQNLADNARKALLDSDERILTLSSRYDEESLVIEVSDTGSGMTPETLSHIFEPFYSASGRGGTGLGLLIVRNIVEAHGGTLDVQSELGKGTVFTIHIPRRA